MSDDQVSFESPPPRPFIAGVGPDAEVVENKAGGRQSACAYSFAEGFPAGAICDVAAVVKHGKEKYGPDNWRKIPRKDHLDHALTHLFAYIAGDEQDDHLEHAACRLLFALETRNEESGAAGTS